MPKMQQKHACMGFNAQKICLKHGKLHLITSPRANGAKRRSGRKPGARVTNFVLAEFKVVARDR